MATRQTLVASFRAMNAAPAAKPTYSPDHINLRNIAYPSLADTSPPETCMRRMLACMQSGERALLKPERQQLIVSLISSRSLRTQHELQAALAGAGCEVTQATISRDLREMGVKKGRDQLGQPRFTLADAPRRGGPEDVLASVLRRFALRVVASQNLVVVRCELGTAPAVAQALDRTENPRILGTLSGDDTCLVVTTGGATAARSVASTLRRSLTT